MGFYLELRQSGEEFAETQIPTVFWVLYAFAGFALSCMVGAAYSLLWDLAREGAVWDRAIIYIIALSVPAYLLIGLKLAFVRKFVRLSSKDALRIGFRTGHREWFPAKILRQEIEDFHLVNQRPTPNIAPSEHEDSQYFIRGHWRIIARLKNGRTKTLDKHTDRVALESLFESCQEWKKKGD